MRTSKGEKACLGTVSGCLLLYEQVDIYEDIIILVPTFHL